MCSVEHVHNCLGRLDAVGLTNSSTINYVFEGARPCTIFGEALGAIGIDDDLCDTC